MAELTYALHGVSVGATSLRSSHDYASSMLNQLEGRGFSSPVLAEARRILESLDVGDTICHGDLNPNNVLMTVDGPRVIDWISAIRGNPMVDLARIAVTLSVVLIPGHIHPGLSTDAFWDIRHEMLSAYLETYAALTGTSPEVLEAGLVPWMTVMAILALDEGTLDQQEWLVLYLQQRTPTANKDTI